MVEKFEKKFLGTVLGGLIKATESGRSTIDDYREVEVGFRKIRAKIMWGVGYNDFNSLIQGHIKSNLQLFSRDKNHNLD